MFGSVFRSLEAKHPKQGKTDLSPECLRVMND